MAETPGPEAEEKPTLRSVASHSKSYGLFPAPGWEDHRGYMLKQNALPQPLAEGESCLRRLWKTPLASAWGCLSKQGTSEECGIHP